MFRHAILAVLAVTCFVFLAGGSYYSKASLEGDDTIQEKGVVESGQTDMPLEDTSDEEGAGKDDTLQEKGVVESGQTDMPLQDTSDEESAVEGDGVQEKGIIDAADEM